MALFQVFRLKLPAEYVLTVASVYSRHDIIQVPSFNPQNSQTFIEYLEAIAARLLMCV